MMEPSHVTFRFSHFDHRFTTGDNVFPVIFSGVNIPKAVLDSSLRAPGFGKLQYPDGERPA